MNPEALRQLNARGVSQVDMAARFNVHPCTVARWFKRYGLRVEKVILDREGLKRLLHTGHTQVEIAAQFHVHAGTVKHWVKRYGLDTPDEFARRMARGAIPAKDQLEKRYCAQGLSTEQIAAQFAVGAASVRRWLKRYGINFRPPAHMKRIEKSELEKLQAQGLTRPEMARRLGVSEHTVSNRVKQYGLKADPAARRQSQRRQQGITERNLSNLYLRGGLSLAELARHYKISRDRAKRVLVESGIPLRKRKSQRPEKEALRQGYVDQHLSLNELGEKCGVSGSAVRFWLDGYGIKRRPPVARRPRFTKEQLQQYRKLTTAEIARRLGVTWGIAKHWLARYGIKSEGERQPRKPRYSKGELYDLYRIKNLPVKEIARLYATSRSTIGKWLKRYGIRKMKDRARVAVRSSAEAPFTAGPAEPDGKDFAQAFSSADQSGLKAAPA